jgi:hypothetical protein
MEIHAVDAVPWHGADDEVLAARVVEDFEAFAELYRRHASVIYKSVRARTPSDDVAEDITARVFFKALINADDWRGGGTYRVDPPHRKKLHLDMASAGASPGRTRGG